MKIVDIKIGDRARRDPGDIESLAKSIEQVGLLHPVVVNPNNELVSGFRRIEAYKLLGRDEIPHRVAENLDGARKLLQAERDENTERKELSPSEMVVLAERLEPLERAQAEKRKIAALTPRKSKASKDAQQSPEAPGGGKLPPREKGKSRDKVAAAVGTSERTLKKAKEIVVAANAEPEKYGALVEEMDATGKVDPAYRKLREIQVEESGSTKPRTPNPFHKPLSGLMHGRNAIRQLEKISKDDLEFEEALNQTIRKAQKMLVDHMLPGQKEEFREAIRREEAGRNPDVALMLTAVDKAATSVATMGGVKALAESWESSDPRDLAMQLKMVAKTLRQWAKTIEDLHPTDAPTAPVNQQDRAGHVDAGGPPVPVAQDGGDPDEPEWRRVMRRNLQAIRQDRDAARSQADLDRQAGNER